MTYDQVTFNEQFQVKRPKRRASLLIIYKLSNVLQIIKMQVYIGKLLQIFSYLNWLFFIQVLEQLSVHLSVYVK